MNIAALLALIPGLATWFESVRRPFPWREDNPDPYRVWISEIMSHQSTMVTVLPYFKRWIEKFPSLGALAAADEDEVIEAWAGLGYYSRARNVLKAANELKAHLDSHGGAWPKTAAEWLALPGVGPYTAAAIASICFDDKVLPLDGNVIRVLSRFWGVMDPLNSARDRQAIEKSLGEVAVQLPLRSHRTVGQALMELGALVCKPGTQAQCGLCPLNARCEAFNREKVAVIPRPKKRPEAQKILSLALLYRNPRGQVLLRKIPPQLRLGGQWEIPLMELSPGEIGLRQLNEIRENFEVSPKAVKHLITKYVYAVHPVEAGLWREKVPADHSFWDPESPLKGTLTTLTRKILLI